MSNSTSTAKIIRTRQSKRHASADKLPICGISNVDYGSLLRLNGAYDVKSELIVIPLGMAQYKLERCLQFFEFGVCEIVCTKQEPRTGYKSKWLIHASPRKGFPMMLCISG